MREGCLRSWLQRGSVSFGDNLGSAVCVCGLGTKPRPCGLGAKLNSVGRIKFLTGVTLKSPFPC